jgi:hypothetical protein
MMRAVRRDVILLIISDFSPLVKDSEFIGEV